MLLIYSALPVGGIETFFCRLAKERFNNGLKTSILLLSAKGESNKELLSEIEKYCAVYFYKDLFKGPSFFGKAKLPRTGLPLLLPVNKNTASGILENSSQIHVTNGICALLAKRLVDLTGISIPITVGVYHSQEFTWGARLPYFEKVNRRFVLECLSTKNLFCFYESTRDFIQAKTGVSLQSAKTFRLGVVSQEKKAARLSEIRHQETKICMIGRLVDFKKYNLWMPQVVAELNSLNHNISLDIYGDGPMIDQIKKEILKHDMQSKVFLKGQLSYSQFDETVSNYDLFIGSGTSIIQAASLGIPSIIGIESNPYPTSYGFFSDFYQYEYHHPDLAFEKLNIRDLILSYLKLCDQKQDLAQSHINAARLFSMSLCSKNFDSDISNTIKPLKYSKFIYILSRILSAAVFKLQNKTIYERAI